MRFISKSAIVINTESLFTLTSKWHHYPLALTCFEDLRLIHPKWNESLSLPPRGLVWSSCRYELPPAPLPRLNCMQLNHSHLGVHSGSHWACAYVLIRPPLDYSHTWHSRWLLIKENIRCIKYRIWSSKGLSYILLDDTIKKFLPFKFLL